MKNLHRIVLMAIGIMALCAGPTQAQGWTHGSYSIQSYIQRVATGSGSSYTISAEADDGLCTAAAAGSTSGTGWGAAVFSVTYTCSGTPPTLTIAAYGLLGDVAAAYTGSTSQSKSYVTSDSAGGLSNTQTAPPNVYGYLASGPGTSFLNPTSPMTFLINGSAYSTYSGQASASANSKVYFLP